MTEWLYDMGVWILGRLISYGFAFIVDNKIVQPTRPTYQGEAGMILEGGGRDGCLFPAELGGKF